MRPGIRRQKTEYFVQETKLLRIFLEDETFVTVKYEPTLSAGDVCAYVEKRRKLEGVLFATFPDGSGRSLESKEPLEPILSDDGAVKLTFHFKYDYQEPSDAPSGSIDVVGDGRKRQPSVSHIIMFDAFHVEDQSEVRELNKFWENFPDIDFKVVKFNGRKRKRTCILRLSREGLMDLDRKTEETIHCQEWKEIDTVFIQQAGHFKVNYKNITRETGEYQSMDASLIVKAIQKRLDGLDDVRNEIAKNSVHLRFQKKLMMEEIKNATAGLSSTSSSPRPSSFPSRTMTEEEIENQQTIRRASVNHDMVQHVIHLFAVHNSEWEKYMKKFQRRLNTNDLNVFGLEQCREFVTAVKDLLMERQIEHFSMMVEPDSDFQEEMNCSVEYALQQVFFLPVMDTLIKMSTIDPKRERKLRATVHKLRNQSQDKFGIKEEHRNVGNWSGAVFEMKKFMKKKLPSEKILCLMDAARSIIRDHAKQNGSDATPLSGDDFLPIITYVIVKTATEDDLITATQLNYMAKLCDPELLKGQEGYYLTVFTCALKYLSSVRIHHTPLKQEEEEETTEEEEEVQGKVC